jgi:hypothetical protein
VSATASASTATTATDSVDGSCSAVGSSVDPQHTAAELTAAATEGEVSTLEAAATLAAAAI